jgi:putative membrane protein
MTALGFRWAATGLSVAIVIGALQAQAQTGATGATTPSDAREFITQMTIAGMAEVQLGKMAEEHGANPDVKSFGQMMVKDHTQANKELAEVASQLKVQPPTQLDQKHRELADRLSKLQGSAFDREYMSAMVKGHEDVASQLRMRTGNRMTSATPATPDRSAEPVGTTGGGEQALTQWAIKTLPAVQQHLERAREIEQKVK